MFQLSMLPWQYRLPETLSQHRFRQRQLVEPLPGLAELSLTEQPSLAELSQRQRVGCTLIARRLKPQAFQ